MTKSEKSKTGRSESTGNPKGESIPGDLILFVDDEENVREMTTLMLEKAGYRVLTAIDGIEAVDVFRLHADEIDLVILDLKMPRMNGDEAFHELREMRSDIPVLLSTGFNKGDWDCHLTENEASGFLQKPYRYIDLVSKLRGILE